MVSGIILAGWGEDQIFDSVSNPGHSEPLGEHPSVYVSVCFLPLINFTPDLSLHLYFGV